MPLLPSECETPPIHAVDRLARAATILRALERVNPAGGDPKAVAVAQANQRKKAASAAALKAENDTLEASA